MGWRVLEESGLVRLPEVDLRHFGFWICLEAHTQPRFVRACQDTDYLRPLTSVNYVRVRSTVAVTLLRLDTGEGHGLSFPSRSEAQKGEACAS